jgi:endonuclease-3
MAQVQVKSQKVQDERRMTEVLKALKREYPEAECSLGYESPFQLLIATILSAQCTDERVNQVTPHLFKKFPTAEAMAQARIPELEKLIQSTGFFRSKAKSLSEASREIVEKHHGKVPQDLHELIKLRGVGRKTANVVLGVAFGVPGLVVDTHVKRLTYRMGFTHSTDPEKIEQEMMKLVPQEDWTLFAHLMIDHGRKICMARRPLCDECPVARYCPKVGVGNH